MNKLFSFMIIISLCFVSIASTPIPDQSYSIISDEVYEALEPLENEDEIGVYVIIPDIDHEAIMEEFASSYPEQYNEYSLATETDIASEQRQPVNGNINEKDNYPELEDPLNGELLQQAIETKRYLSANAYTAMNQAFADSLVSKDKQEFISQYSPMVILFLSKNTILGLEDNDNVCRVELLVNFKLVEELQTANQVSRANYVRDTNGNSGSGVKIGQIDTGVPDISYADLQYSAITRHTTTPTNDHATRVARILVGQANGVAPNASLYSTTYGNYHAAAFYQNAEWLISQGVNIINMSAYVYPETGQSWAGKYIIVDKWVDHIAVQHDVHFVKSSGNTGGYVTNPGMAYNAITVGGFNDKNTLAQTDDSNLLTSAHDEYATINRAEKPNIIASAYNILVGTNDSGTSFAAPQVAGVIAQLCSYQSALKTKQAVMGAMLSVGAKYKIDGTSGNGVFPDTYQTTAMVNGSLQISKVEGAGKLDARCPRSVASSGNYWSPTILTSNFPYTQTVYISTSSNSLVRVGIFWLKRNSISSGVSHTAGSVNETESTDLNLYVYAPNGNLVASSTTLYSNYEIAQFGVTQSGNYTIKIVRNGSSSSTKEHVGIAVW